MSYCACDTCSICFNDFFLSIIGLHEDVYYRRLNKRLANCFIEDCFLFVSSTEDMRCIVVSRIRVMNSCKVHLSQMEAFFDYVKKVKN